MSNTTLSAGTANSQRTSFVKALRNEDFPPAQGGAGRLQRSFDLAVIEELDDIPVQRRQSTRHPLGHEARIVDGCL
jgi:hypothetical protein